MLQRHALFNQSFETMLQVVGPVLQAANSAHFKCFLIALILGDKRNRYQKFYRPG